MLTGDMFSVSTSVDAAEGQVADVLASGTFVVLDTELTPELEAEGYARDVVRAVQDERKNAGLHIADRIDLSLTVPTDHVADVEAWRDMIAAETLALSLTVEAGDKLAGARRQALSAGTGGWAAHWCSPPARIRGGREDNLPAPT